MKKLFVVFMSLMFIMCLAGCGDSQDKVNVDFVIDGKSHLVEINKGTSVSKDIIPLSSDEEVVKLYYDENMENEYDGKILNEDSKMYVKNMGEEKLYNEVCEAYLNKFIKPIRENSTVEDVWVFEYLGTYGDSYVAVILDRQNCDFPEVVNDYSIENFYFSYSVGYDIIVYKENEFLKLNEAYDCNILNIFDIEKIYKKYYNL